MTQQRVLEILKTGANVLLTGEPGSGTAKNMLRLERRGFTKTAFVLLESGGERTTWISYFS